MSALLAAGVIALLAAVLWTEAWEGAMAAQREMDANRKGDAP